MDPQEQIPTESGQDMQIMDDIPDPGAGKEQRLTNPGTAPNVDKLRVPTAEREVRNEEVIP